MSGLGVDDGFQLAVEPVEAGFQPVFQVGEFGGEEVAEVFDSDCLLVFCPLPQGEGTLLGEWLFEFGQGFRDIDVEHLGPLLDGFAEEPAPGLEQVDAAFAVGQGPAVLQIIIQHRRATGEGV